MQLTKIKKKTKIITLFLILIFGLIFTYLSFNYFHYKIKDLEDLAYTQESMKMKHQLHNMIEEKRNATIAISVALAQNSLVEAFLKGANYETNINSLQKLSQELRKNTLYKNIWLHIISTDGTSIARSWSPKHSDSLLSVREDIRYLIKTPRQMSTISVGRYTISFKAITPVRNKKDKLLGYIEVITHFKSIAKELQKQDYDSLLVVDERYKKQLIHNLTNQFIGDYYLAYFQVKNYPFSLVKNLDIKKHIINENYLINQNYYFVTYPLYNNQKQIIAYYILIKDIHLFNYKQRDDFINTIRIILFISLLIMLSIIVLFYTYSKGIKKQKKYFQNIVDTISEIVIITDGQETLDANKAFFTFFDEFKSLQEFQDKYNCICDLFAKEEGYVSKDMGKLLWYEFIFSHPKDKHKVKIFYKNKTYIFSIHIKLLEQANSSIYTLALSDITRSEKYKEKLEHISKTDMLTSIGNRYKFDEDIKREFFRAKRYKSPLSLVMLDIDYFKKVNDTYGHDAGDQALIALSKEVRSLLRYSDIFCRYGGEEFIIIMPESTMIESKISANRIRKHVEELQIKDISHITISLGVTELQEDDTLESLLKRVDKALYLSKENGRNRVSSL